MKHGSDKNDPQPDVGWVGHDYRLLYRIIPDHEREHNTHEDYACRTTTKMHVPFTGAKQEQLKLLGSRLSHMLLWFDVETPIARWVEARVPQPHTIDRLRINAPSDVLST